MSTKEYIPVKDHINVMCARRAFPNWVISMHTKDYIQVRDHINVMCARRAFVHQGI
jgi:hypothetical protein